MTQYIYPSVMAETQQELNKLFKKLEGVAQTLHLDIADGKAVPNKSLWFPFKLSSNFKYNAHLMIKNPEKWIKKNGKKVDLCISQFGEVKNVEKYIEYMQKSKKKVGFALRPETNFSDIKPFLKDVDVILILTVHPGFYGAKFLKAPLKKINQIKNINPKIEMIIDGGMNLETIGIALDAGGNKFVSGSFVTKSDFPIRAMKALRSIVTF